MALQPNDLGKKFGLSRKWDQASEEEAVKIVDTIEGRIDSDLIKAYEAGFGTTPLVLCPEQTNHFVLKEIVNRYHGWRIESCSNLGGFYKDRLVFYPKDSLSCTKAS